MKDREKPMKYKVCMVVKGFNHKKGIDFEEIFFPVVKMRFIQVVSSLVVSMNLEFEQLNIETALLDGDLEEEIYMVQSKEFEVKQKEHIVCILKKSSIG